MPDEDTFERERRFLEMMGVLSALRDSQRAKDSRRRRQEELLRSLGGWKPGENRDPGFLVPPDKAYLFGATPGRWK